jgi:hypothetical protein
LRELCELTLYGKRESKKDASLFLSRDLINLPIRERHHCEWMDGLRCRWSVLLLSLDGTEKPYILHYGFRPMTHKADVEYPCHTVLEHGSTKEGYSIGGVHVNFKDGYLKFHKKSFIWDSINNKMIQGYS